MTLETHTFVADSQKPRANGGKSMKFTFQPESKPLDGYTIKRAIHRGGFGEVYYALTDGGKEVALKLLKQHLNVELRGISQCLNLKHPNLVTIFDVKQDADGDHWVVMEYIAGKSLAQVLDGSPEGMPMGDAEQWLAGMAAGLSFLHDRGIVHRDFKPANVFLENSVVKIGDVGLSKFISESHRSAQTQSVGTVYYMAPEIAHGRYGREVDVYSLGIVLYELLTGRVPFSGESAGEILMKHLSEKPDLSPIPRRLRPLLAQALEKDPLRRTPTAKQLLEDFKKAVVGLDVPQEIPEDSFYHSNMPDRSAIERELGRHLPDDFPEMVPDDVAYWMGLEHSARLEMYKKHLERWAAERGRNASRQAKEAIAADVAKAIRLAEEAARRARAIAEGAGRGSRHHRRYADRLRRKMERRNGFARHSRHRPPSFWNWGYHAAASNEGGTNEGRERPVEATLRTDVRPERSAGGWFGRRSIAFIIIGLIVLKFHRRPGPDGMLDFVAQYAVCAALVYGIYKCGSYLFRSAMLWKPIKAAPALATNSWSASPPVASASAAAAAYRQEAQPPPVPAVAQQRSSLGPDTLRSPSARQRMSELTLSLTYAALCAVMLMAGLTFFPGSFSDGGQIAQFGGTLLAASWLILAQAKMWEGSQVEPGIRRILLILTGVAVGVCSWWLDRALFVDVPTNDSLGGMFHRIGPYHLLASEEKAAAGTIGPIGPPALAGYIVFFGCLTGLRQWWRQADSFRRKNLAVFSVISAALLGFALTAVFAFPTGWATLWAAAISATVQLSAAWVPPRNRAPLIEEPRHV